MAFVFAILAMAAGPVGCAGTSAEHAHIQWSEPTTVVSPDRTWVLSVHPVLNSDENRSSVTLRKCGGTQERPVMVLKRNAEVYWGNKGRLLVIDAPVADSYRIRLFELYSNGSVEEAGGPTGVDGEIRKKLGEDFSNAASTQFYLPKLISWSGSQIVLSIGGTVTFNSDGPMKPYCYDATINSQTARIENLTRVAQPLAASGTGCQIFP